MFCYLKHRKMSWTSGWNILRLISSRRLNTSQAPSGRREHSKHKISLPLVSNIGEHSLTHSCTQPLTHTFTYLFAHSPIHLLTHSLTHSFTYPLARSLTHTFTCSLTLVYFITQWISQLVRLYIILEAISHTFPCRGTQNTLQMVTAIFAETLAERQQTTRLKSGSRSDEITLVAET
jgi:hypothetical protein